MIQKMMGEEMRKNKLCTEKKINVFTNKDF